MKLLAASVLVFVICATAVPQEIEHAPALQSCTADLNLWTAQIPGWPSPSAEQYREGTKTLTVREMQKRALYLEKCSDAYPALIRTKSGEIPGLVGLIMAYSNEIQQRYGSFLERHALLDKFTLEDEAGKR